MPHQDDTSSKPSACLVMSPHHHPHIPPTGGDMFNYVTSRRYADGIRGRLKEAEARWYFQQLILAVDYLHKMVRTGAGSAGWDVGGGMNCTLCIVGFALYHWFANGYCACARKGIPVDILQVDTWATTCHCIHSCSVCCFCTLHIEQSIITQGIASRDIKLENCLLVPSPQNPPEFQGMYVRRCNNMACL